MNTKEPILVAVAWPYANGLQHIGHIAGAYLPPDIFARFSRMDGREVLMVSGSDTHGTPVTLKAEEQNTTPEKLIEHFHGKFVECYQKIGLTFDLFTHTHTENHEKVVHEVFLDLLAKGYIYRDKSKQLFDKKAQKFLPDRYIEGECPLCGFKDARGDQCDNCGKTYDAVDLKHPVSKMTGSTDLEVRDTEHYYIDLAKLNDQLLDWASTDKGHWRKHVLNFTLGELSKKELRGRPITRDLEWGITIPQPGNDTKRIYVWFEAVMGYLSAVKEWATLCGTPEKWTHYWQNKDSRAYYFIGKDNITFHSVLWPAILMAKGDLNLPYDVPANEYLNTFGRKISKSRGTAISVLDILERYQPDAWRYALAALAPETADVDFTWDDFLEKVNNELVANWGNCVNRTLGFAFKRYDEKIPAAGPLTAEDKQVLADVKAGFESVGQLYRAVRLRAALEETRKLSQRVNQYLNDMAPWTTIKTDPERAATTVHTALQCITWVNTMFSPVLPFSAQSIYETLGFDGKLFGRQYTQSVSDAKGTHEVLRYDHSEAVGIWQALELKPGQQMRQPSAPFIKLDPALIEQEFTPEA